MANPAAELRARVLADHPEAVVVERGRNNLKHRLADTPDGRPRFALDCTIGSLHYGPSQDQEIDTAFLPSTAPWDWEMTKAGFEVRALSRLDAGQVIEYRSGSEYVRFQPMALQYSNALDQIQPISMPEQMDAAIDDDTLTWADGYGPGIGISWQAQTARLAKRLTIGSPAALPPVEQFILDGGEPCLELNFIFAYSKGVTPWINGEPWDKKQRETQGLVEFRDGDGNVLWWFNLPRSWDAEINQQLGTFRFKRVGNSLYVSHRVPLAFIQAATYPLTIDVDVDEQVADSLDDVTCRVGYFTKTESYPKIGREAAYNWDAANRFTTVAVPKDATIGACYGTLRSAGNYTNTLAIKVHFEAHDDATRIADEADFYGRSLTTGTDWDFSTEWSVGEWYNTIDCSSDLQAVVNRAGWASGQALIQFIKEDGSAANQRRQFRAYDLDSGDAPKLHIEYSVGGVTHEGTAALAGAGTLSVLGGVIRKAVLALAGAGALAVAAVATLVGSASPAGAGTLTATAQCYVPGTASIAGGGALSVDAIRTRTASANLSGEGTLAVDAIITRAGAANLSGEGTLSVDAVCTRAGTASLSGEGTLTAAAVTELVGASSLAGESTLEASGTISGIKEGAASLAGEGTLVVAGVRTLIGAAPLVAEGTLTVAAQNYKNAAASLAGEGTLQAASVRTLTGIAALTGDGALTASGQGIYSGSATLVGDGTLTVVAVTAIVHEATASLSGEGTLSVQLLVFGEAALSGIGTLTVTCFGITTRLITLLGSIDTLKELTGSVDTLKELAGSIDILKELEGDLIMPTTQNTDWICGEAITIWITIAGEGSIAGYNFNAAISPGYGSTAVITKTSGDGLSIYDADTRVIQIDIAQDDSEDLEPGTYVWDVWRTDADYEACLTRGEIELGSAV